MKNPQLEDGYTQIANEILSALCRFRIPGELRQILDTVIRKTYGYHKKSDWISNSQIIEATGLKKANASRGLSKLITHGIVIKNDNKLSLNKDYSAWISFGRKVIKTDNSVIKKATTVIRSDNKKLSKVMDTKDNKNTITKENIQKKLPLYKKMEYLSNIPEEDYPFHMAKLNITRTDVRRKAEQLILWCETNGKKKKNYKAFLRIALIRDFKYAFNE